MLDGPAVEDSTSSVIHSSLNKSITLISTTYTTLKELNKKLVENYEPQIGVHIPFLKAEGSSDTTETNLVTDKECKKIIL